MAVSPRSTRRPLIQAQVDIRAAEKGLTGEEAKADLLAEKQPSKQFATTDQLGGLAAFICSPAADQITGQELGIDGGWTAQ
jgi:3-hydroxybutyrate dehydrogenase